MMEEWWVFDKDPDKYISAWRTVEGVFTKEQATIKAKQVLLGGWIGRQCEHLPFADAANLVDILLEAEMDDNNGKNLNNDPDDPWPVFCDYDKGARIIAGMKIQAILRELVGKSPMLAVTDVEKVENDDES